MIGAEVADAGEVGMAQAIAPASRVARSGIQAAVATKRAVDVAGGLLLLLVGIPVVLVASVAILVDDGWPIIYKSPRIGREGRHFPAYKLRTMRTDAQEVLSANPRMMETFRRIAKVPNDPRVTRVGSVLRRLSVDELPQALNVIRGHMSLVGPRPSLPHELDNWGPFAEQRLRVKPGLTGLWQVSGRSLLSYEERLRLDAHYIANWTLSLDLKILLKTLPAVLSGRGAT